MAQRYATGDRLNRRHFQRLAFGQRRQEAGQTARQECLARPRRPAEQQVVRARRGKQQRPFGRKLPLHLIQIGIGFAGVEQAIGNIRLNRRMPIEMRDCLQQMIHRNHFQARRQARLLGIGPRHHQRSPGLARRQCRRQYTTHSPDRT
ncbi:hypothetical protein D3C84_832100 [compost metagenome]